MPFKSSGRGAYGPQGQKVIKGPLAPVWVTFSPGAVGTSAFSYTFVATDDSGDAPTYSVASGSIPTGLTLNSSTGVLSGTATVSGTFTYTLRATDVNGRFTDTTSISQVVSLALYTFPSPSTFTTNGQAGQGGSDVSQGRASLGSPAWANTYLTNGSYTGWWSWTVPGTGTYRFVVAGSKGQNGNLRAGGNGAAIQGTISLTQGEVLQLAIGKYYTNATSSNVSGGGGGASLVYRNNTGAPIFVGGGGGGGGGNWTGNGQVGANGGTTNNGVPTPPNTPVGGDEQAASTGNGGYSGTGGGLSYNGTGAGGGWANNGQDGNNSGGGGVRLSAGGFGGNAADDGTNIGGFGGGGGGRNVCGAGAGGYTGGNASFWDGTWTGGGGGGGSWTGTGVTFESAAASNAGLGYITITRL